MHDEISLKEILQVLWSKKITIAVVTVAMAIVTGGLNLIFSSTYYAATSYLAVSNSELVEPQDIVLAPHISQVLSNSSIQRMMTNLSLDSTYNVKSLKENISISEEGGLITINVKDTHSETAKRIANQMAIKISSNIQITDLTADTAYYKRKQVEAQNELEIAKSELAKAEAVIASLPESLVTTKSLSEEPFLQSVVSENSSISAGETGAITMSDEEVNPVFVQIKTQQLQYQINVDKLITEVSIYEERIKENQQRINELEATFDNDILASKVTITSTSATKAITITPAVNPDEALGKKTILKVSIAGLFSAAATSILILLTHYWRQEKAQGGSSVHV